MGKRFILKLSLIACVFIGLLSSCGIDDAPEQEPLWYSYGTYEVGHADYEFTVLLDNGYELLPENDMDFEVVLDNKTRVFISFVVDSQTEETIYATVGEMSRILTTDIIQLNEEIEDSIGYDGLMLTAGGVWLSKYHLNVSFTYYGGGVIHNINLVKPIGAQTDSLGNQILELRHNANDDDYTQSIDGIIAFSMDSLYVEGMDSLPFVLRSYDYDSTLTELKGTHHFSGANLLRKKATKIRKEYSILIE